MHQYNEQIVFTSTLYVIATPIGNLGDITHRALGVLNHVDLIAAEDTRHTGLLLKHFNIKATRLFALHDNNENQKTGVLLEKLKNGQSIALVSDAGTPLISDPGYHLVRSCREEGIRVMPLPGACAAIAALSASGIASDRFCYEGFLPSKAPSRQNALKALIEEKRTLIFYESPHRILDSLQDMASIFGEERYVVLARELTKTWESIYGAPVQQLLNWIKEDKNRHRGEMVLIMEGHRIKSDNSLPHAALETFRLLHSELSIKKSAALTSKIHHVKKNALYRYALDNNWQD